MIGTPASAPPPSEDLDLPPAAHRRMAAVLRVGLAVALVLLAGGLVALLVRSAGSDAGGWVHANPLVGYLDPAKLAGGLAAGAPTAYLTLGVYALVATPVVRVATGITAFAGHRERRMVALTTVVLALLLVGLFVVGPLVR
jgi:uncharacterized membrane protein